MNYKLCVKNGDIARILDMSSIFKNKKDGFNLELLDKFTRSFKNEEELKAYLLAKNIISESELQYDIEIKYGDKNIRYAPVMYSGDKEFENIKALSDSIKRYFEHRKNVSMSTDSYDGILDNYRNITEYFEVFEKISRSKNFLNVIIGFVRANPKQGLNVEHVDMYINTEFGTPKCRYLYIALFEIFRRQFYDYNKETKDLKFNYKKFRDFCIFYLNYKSNVLSRRQSSNNKLDMVEDYDYEQLKMKGF